MFGKKQEKREVYKISVDNWMYKYYVCAESEHEALDRLYKKLSNSYPAICLSRRNYEEFKLEDLHVICHFYIGALDRDEQVRIFGKDLKDVYEIGGGMSRYEEVTVNACKDI